MLVNHLNPATCQMLKKNKQIHIIYVKSVTFFQILLNLQNQLKYCQVIKSLEHVAKSRKSIKMLLNLLQTF